VILFIVVGYLFSSTDLGYLFVAILIFRNT